MVQSGPAPGRLQTPLLEMGKLRDKQEPQAPGDQPWDAHCASAWEAAHRGPDRHTLAPTHARGHAHMLNACSCGNEIPQVPCWRPRATPWVDKEPSWGQLWGWGLAAGTSDRCRPLPRAQISAT